MKAITRSTLAIGPILVAGITIGLYWRYNGTLPPSSSAERRPNIILFLADDTGYADFQSFGHPTQEWGPVDRMAEEGMKFTQWTSSDRLCSPSRASTLTGRYAPRSGVYGKRAVFHSDCPGGLPRREITIAEALKDEGYATGMVGKWHLGINREKYNDGYHLPVHHGFEFVGRHLPYSQWWNCDLSNPWEHQVRECFLYNNDTIVEQPINLETLTQRLVDDAKSFINKNKDKPFFFFFSFPQTHQAMFCDKRFCGKSERGSYGDNVNEMAWAVGEVLDELKRLCIEKDTLAIFTSDHGPENFDCNDEGSSGMFRGGKGSTWEGGFRVPAIAWWPGTVPAGKISKTLVNSLDILPTALHLAGAADYMSSRNVTTDGQLILDIVKDAGNHHSHRESLFYYCSDRIMAVRYKKYKVHYYTYGLGSTRIVDSSEEPLCEHDAQSLFASLDCYGDKVLTWDPPLVFDLMNDPQESLRLNTSTLEMQSLLAKVDVMIKEHQATVVRVPSEIDKTAEPEYIPCCQPPDCTCNYNA